MSNPPFQRKASGRPRSEHGRSKVFLARALLHLYYLFHYVPTIILYCLNAGLIFYRPRAFCSPASNFLLRACRLSGRGLSPLAYYRFARFLRRVDAHHALCALFASPSMCYHIFDTNPWWKECGARVGRAHPLP